MSICTQLERCKRMPWHEEIIPFESIDGFQCNLVHVQGSAAPHKGPVLLVHGAGVRANLFRAPVETTIVDYLLERGYDVWMENWRASIDLAFSSWTLDQAAVYDHPTAVEKVIQCTGAASVKAIVHCQGSTSFVMSAVAGLLPKVSVIVSNAVALHPVIPNWSEIKMPLSVSLLRPMTTYLDCQWGVDAPTILAKAVAELVRLTHHECDNMVCKMVSFTYGSGFPALWSHANLNDATHDWLRHEFAKVPLTFFAQMILCVRAGHLIPVDGLKQLPSDLFARPPQTDARFAFFAGIENKCFLPASQQKTFEWFDRHAGNRHSLHLLPNYGHLDVFMGKHAARDIFPAMYQELDRS